MAVTSPDTPVPSADPPVGVPDPSAPPAAPQSDQEAYETLERTWADPTGIWGWLRSLQNDAIGLRIIFTAFCFFLAAGVLALIMRLQLIGPESTFVSAETYNRLYTVHGSTMMYLFSVPMLEGIAIILLPLMLGNREMPFPRLGIFAYFTFLFGGLLFFSSFLLNAAPDTGWYAYVPLSGPEYSPGIALDFWLLALSVAEIGAIAAGIEIMIAVLKMRAPGMSLSRTPVYGWAMLVTAVSILFAFTPLIIGSLLLELDRKFGTHFFNPEMNGAPVLWQHLFWIFGHPDVYIQFIPALGIVSMIVPVFSRQRLVGYTYVVMAIVATGFISFALWVHHMFTVGLPQMALMIFSVASIFIGIPAGVQIIAYTVTILSGRPVWKTPLLFVMGFIATFVLGGITGIMVGLVPLDWQLHDSYFIVAHFHYVLVGGVVFPIFAALYFWLPKQTNKLFDERLGKWNFWLMFIGFNVAFFPQHIVGILGMPRRVYTYKVGFGWDIYNLISTIGAFLFAAGVLVFIINFFYHLKWGQTAGANPWGADTLEWAMDSPAPNFGFSILPIVHGRHPLWEEKTLEEGDEKMRNLMQDLGHWPLNWRAALVTSSLDGRPEEVFRVSGPSIYPFIAAVGMIVIFASEIFTLRQVSLVGIGIVILSLIGWHWPTDAPTSWEEEDAFAEKHGILVRTTGSRAVSRWSMIIVIVILFIALTTFVFSYFYIRLQNEVWPPGRLDLPNLIPAAIGSVLLVLSCLPVVTAWRSIKEDQKNRAKIGLAAGLVLGIAAFGALYYDFSQVPFGMDTNAYGSLYYVLNGYLFAMLLGGFGMNVMVQIWLWLGYLSARRYIGIENIMLYWLAMTVAWFVIMATVYLMPYA